MEKIKNNIMREQIKVLADLIAEKRSDIHEILYDILEGREWTADQIESRYVKAELPDGTLLFYDTLKTEIEYFNNKTMRKWETLDCDYEDDKKLTNCSCCNEELSKEEMVNDEVKAIGHCFGCQKGKCEKCN